MTSRGRAGGAVLAACLALAVASATVTALPAAAATNPQVRDLTLTVKGHKATATWKAPASAKGVVGLKVEFLGSNDFGSAYFGTRSLKPSATRATATWTADWCVVGVRVTPLTGGKPGFARIVSVDVPCSHRPPDQATADCNSNDAASDPACSLKP